MAAYRARSRRALESCRRRFVGRKLSYGVQSILQTARPRYSVRFGIEEGQRAELGGGTQSQRSAVRDQKEREQTKQTPDAEHRTPNIE